MDEAEPERSQRCFKNRIACCFRDQPRRWGCKVRNETRVERDAGETGRE